MSWKHCVETFPTADGQFGWHLKAKRGGKIMCQGEGHPTRSNARRAARAVQRAFATVPSDIPYFNLTERPQ